MAERTIFFLKGLPASGKSTWAKDYVASHKNTIRVNKDDLRLQLHGGKFSKENEKVVLATQRAMVVRGMRDEQNVIIDNTHLSGSHEEEYRKLVDDWNIGNPKAYEFKVKEFHTDVETCIERDKLRGDASVGENVIRRMSKDSGWGNKPPEFSPVTVNKGFAACIIVDIDGTLAYMNGRSPYDYSRVGEDGLHVDVLQMIRYFAYAYEKKRNEPIFIIIASGRKDDCKAETIEWLDLNGVHYDEIHMRPAADARKDSVVKREILDDLLTRYNPIAVFDDRNQVVSMWRESGLRCYQVADGNF